MKISERKQRLRARGVVPVPQEATHRTVMTTPARAASKTATSKATTRKGAAPPQKARRQPSPRYQMVFGAAYMVFTPLLLYDALITEHTKHSAGILGFVLPIVFFLFGAWFFNRGWQASRRQRAGAAAPPTTAASSKNRPSATVAASSESRPGPAAGAGLKVGLARLFKGSPQ